MTKLTYHGLKTQRSTVESTPLLDASNKKIKARKSNTEWQEERQDITLGADPNSGGSSSRLDYQWETDF